MHRTDFPDSDALVWAEYDEDAQELTILLRNYRIYRYFQVPDWEYDRLVTAESAGRYYNRHIRTGYGFLELEPPGRSRRSRRSPAPLS